MDGANWQQPMPDIFISYRRDDARADAGRLYDRLATHFGHERVFMDVDDIPPGTDFVQHLHTTLAGCGAVLVVIGDAWTAPDERTGRPRIFDPGDFVHLEVRTALERDVPVVPVLVGGASMPPRDELPDDIGPLLNRQAVELRHARFSDDVDRLVESLSVDHAGDGSWVSRRTMIAGIVAVLAGAGGYVAYRYAQPTAVRLRSAPARITPDAAKASIVSNDFFDARFNAAGGGTAKSLQATVVGGDVVVTDPAVGLMWQSGGAPRPMVLADTRTAVERTNDRAYAGFSDWRLPTLEEAMSLMRPDKHDGYHIDPAFEAGAAPFVWTADRPAADSGWVVYYYDGRCVPESKRFNAWVRLVRATDS